MGAQRVLADEAELADSELLRLISRGDLHALETTYDRHIEAAWKVALAYSANVAAAEHAVFAAFQALWREPAPGNGASLSARLLSSVVREARRPRLVALGDVA